MHLHKIHMEIESKQSSKIDVGLDNNDRNRYR